MAGRTKTRRKGKSAARITSADIADTVVARILEVMEAGGDKWVKPWVGLAANPHNPVTGTTYKGVNHLWLSFHEGVLATGDARFVTFNGATELAAKALGIDKDAYKAGVLEGTYEPAVLKGSKSVPVYFAKRIKVDDPDAPVDEDSDGKKWVFLWKTFNVFHLATQVNPAYVPEVKTTPVSGADQVAVIEAMVATLGAKVTHDGGDKAYYVPSAHTIHLPRLEDFTSTTGYVATVLHELSHWTKGAGVERGSAYGPVTGLFGSEGYAREEVRAEIAASIVATSLNMAGHCEHAHDGEQTAAYVNSWVKALKANPREVLEAARDAQKIADHLLAAVPAASTTEDEEAASPALVAA